jgi:penicillin-binding protein 1A
LIELRLAGLLERSLTKDQILEMYVNAIYLGNGVYGIEGASRDIFGKSVSRLSVSEGAVLAAIAKGPSFYTPKRHYDRALARRDVVLRLMEREGFLSERAVARAKRDDIRVRNADWRPAQENESFALDFVRTQVASLLRSVNAGGGGELTVYTSLDLDAQRAAERSIRTHASRIERDVRGGVRRVSGGAEVVQGAMVAIDPRDGELRAMVGGRDHVRGTFNRALSARRQPGSAFKPFVYAAALSAGFTPATMVDDEPLTLQVGDKMWSPANYGDEYRGAVTLRTALTYSANAATVRVSRAVGERRVAAQARRNGIDSDLQAVPAIALGAVEVTPIELVTAYAPFANGGTRVQPRVVRKISSDDGTVLWRGREPINEQVMVRLPGRPVRPTTAVMYGLSDTRRPCSPASGLGTTPHVHLGARRRAGVMLRSRGEIFIARVGARARAAGPPRMDWWP